MPVTAKAKQIRISPRKVRLVTRILPGKNVDKAEADLKFLNKAAADPVLAVLKSAVANAENNFDMEPSNLYVKKVLVNEGPTYKRWRARSRGMAAPIKKRSSHISLVLEEREKGKKKSKDSKKKSEKPKVVKLKSKKDIGKLMDKDGDSKEGDKGKKTGYFQKGKDKSEKPGQEKGVKSFVNKMFRRKSEG